MRYTLICAVGMATSDSVRACAPRGADPSAFGTPRRTAGTGTPIIASPTLAPRHRQRLNTGLGAHPVVACSSCSRSTSSMAAIVAGSHTDACAAAQTLVVAGQIIELVRIPRSLDMFRREPYRLTEPAEMGSRFYVTSPLGSGDRWQDRGLNTEKCNDTRLGCRRKELRSKRR